MTESLEKIKTWPKTVQDYFNELKLEMRRVTWPSRKQVESTTVVVILTVFAFAAYFFVVDKAMFSAVHSIQTAFSK